MLIQVIVQIFRPFNRLLRIKATLFFLGRQKRLDSRGLLRVRPYMFLCTICSSLIKICCPQSQFIRNWIPMQFRGFFPSLNWVLFSNRMNSVKLSSSARQGIRIRGLTLFLSPRFFSIFALGSSFLIAFEITDRALDRSAR